MLRQTSAKPHHGRLVLSRRFRATSTANGVFTCERLSRPSSLLPHAALCRFNTKPWPCSCSSTSKVVDRAVIATGMDDDEWRARLERGQKLAREAETRRRDSRDAKRTAEETIAKQAAELKRLKEEAKEARSRGGSGRRSWRSYDVSFPLFVGLLIAQLEVSRRYGKRRPSRYVCVCTAISCPVSARRPPRISILLPGPPILALTQPVAATLSACSTHTHPSPHLSYSSRASRHPWQTTACAS